MDSMTVVITPRLWESLTDLRRLRKAYKVASDETDYLHTEFRAAVDIGTNAQVRPAYEAYLTARKHQENLRREIRREERFLGWLISTSIPSSEFEVTP